MKSFLALLLLLLASQSIAIPEPPNKSLVVKNSSGTGEVFLGGVYMYKSVDWTKEIMEDHFNLLSSLGVNLIHINSLNYYQSSGEEVLALAKLHNMKIIYQIDSAYFTGSVEQSKVEQAISVINKYIDDDTFIGFNVKEEPSEGFIDALMDYYQEIYLQSGIEHIPFFLLHNQTSASNKVKDEYSEFPYIPAITGTDRYMFRFHITSGNGYIMTPKKVFSTHNSSNIGFPFFYNNRVQNQSFVGVITSNANQKTFSKETLASFAGCTVTQIDAGTCTKYNRWYSLAESNNQGLSLGANPGEITSWSHYRPPHNAMAAQTWLAIANGSQAVMAWSAQPTPSAFRGLVENGAPHYTFIEYSNVLNEVRDLGWVANRMVPKYTTETFSAEYINQPSYYNSDLYERRFSIEGINGDVVVLVNTLVGTWNGSNRNTLSLTDNYRLDENGEVIPEDYTPFYAAESIRLSSGENVYDIKTGELLSNNELTIDPGMGRFLFVGTEAQLTKLRNAAGLSS